MGLQKKDRITYLKATEGKLRRKTEATDPEAEERFVEKTGKTVHERVYTTCEGYLRDIRVQTHEEYGTSYNLILLDPATGEKFSINVGESSRYFQSFVEHLPNIDFSKPLEVRPYSFKTEAGRAIGMSFKQEGEKVENYYKDYDAEKNKSTAKNGLEKFNFKGAKGDKDELKILRLKLIKFLKAELKKQVQRLLEYIEQNPEEPKPTTSQASQEDASILSDEGHEGQEDDQDEEEQSKKKKKEKKEKPQPKKAPKGRGKDLQY